MWHNLAQLLRYRGLIQSLVARELKARYRGIGPRLLLVVRQSAAAAARSTRSCSRRFSRAPMETTVQPYAVFMFCGLLPWTWFSASLLEAAGSLISGGNLIKKVLFPAEVLPIVSVLANMVHFFLGLPILAAFMISSTSIFPIGGRALCGFRSSSPFNWCSRSAWRCCCRR